MTTPQMAAQGLLYTAQPMDGAALLAAFRKDDWRDLLPELDPKLRPGKVWPERIPGTPTAPEPSHSQLAAIERDLAAAETAMADRRYQDAVEQYESVRARIYLLLTDGGKARPGLGTLWSPPHDPKDLQRMLAAGIRLAEVELYPTSNLAVIEPEAEAPPRQKIMSMLGLQVDKGLPSDAARSERQAQRLVQAGDWQDAARVYERLAAGRDISPQLKAELLLNQGAAQVQAGDLAGGRGVLERARELFQSTGDQRGAAHAAAAESLPLQVAGSAVAAHHRLVAGVVAGTDVVELAWSKSRPLRTEQVLEAIYKRRAQAKTIPELGWSAGGGADLATHLPHLYYYVTAFGLGDAHRGLENWPEARAWYWRAADYDYLNQAVEAPVLWERIAATHLAEGDGHYQRDDPQHALSAYAQVVVAGPQAPTGEKLYRHKQLSAVGAKVAAFLSDPDADAPDVPLAVKAVVLDLTQRVTQLAAGLDWLGMPAHLVPPFTFEYLQGVARQFALQAQAAARDYIQFTVRYDEGRLTRLQLVQAATDAGNEVALARQHEQVARREREVAEAARSLAKIREGAATLVRNEFAASMPERERLEYLLSWYSGPTTKVKGTDRRAYEYLADYRHELAMLTNDFELLRMDLNIQELKQAKVQADRQVDAAAARQQSAALATRAARVRQDMARQLVSAYDASAFTPGVWANLAHFMSNLSRRYLHHATRVARLMQRAYEFEYDGEFPNRIQADYAAAGTRDTRSGFALTAADRLLADIDWFTFHRATETQHRTLRGSMRVSLAQRFPFLLLTEFRRSGRVAFETLLSDVERQWPGSFHHRIQAVEVEVVGLLPHQGVHGTLRNGGISQYRTATGQVRWRLQPPGTMLISAYSPLDAPVFRHRPEQLGVFEGAGLAGTWMLDIPLSTNDLDPDSVVDVVITLHFEAYFDPTLEERVRARPTPPEALRGSQAFSLRWDFPDRFFLWHSEGETSLGIDQTWLPRHHTDAAVRVMAVQLVGEDGAVPPAIPVTLGTPGRGPVTVTPDGAGQVPSSDPALGTLAGATVVGDWLLATDADQQARERVYDILLFVEYDFVERGVS